MSSLRTPVCAAAIRARSQHGHPRWSSLWCRWSHILPIHCTQSITHLLKAQHTTSANATHKRLWALLFLVILHKFDDWLAALRLRVMSREAHDTFRAPRRRFRFRCPTLYPWAPVYETGACHTGRCSWRSVAILNSSLSTSVRALANDVCALSVRPDVPVSVLRGRPGAGCV